MIRPLPSLFFLSAALFAAPYAAAQESDGSSVPAVVTNEPQSVVLDEITKDDDNTIGLLSIPQGGRLTRCSSGTTYLHLPNAAATMNAVFKDPRSTPTSMEDYTLQFAHHHAIDKILPTTAILFANHSETANQTHFRVFALRLLDVVTPGDATSSAPDVMYRVDVMNLVETTGNSTQEQPPEHLFSDVRPVEFPQGSLLMDLIDANDEAIDEDKRNSTLANMVETGVLVYNSNRFAERLASPDGLVRSQGVLTLWLLGPFSIPLYPAFIACCAVTIWIWYLIQPFLFCCII